jgi:uncharacterized protein
MVLNLKDNFRTRESAFSYRCHACNKCCHGKGIQVNPYETMRLSGLLGIATTEFRQKYLNQQMLKHKPDSDACIFLGENGCTVHKDRPLVCRLYPLGRLRLNNGREIFTELTPHPESEGEYGTSSTVEGYLQTQEVESYLQAEKLYSEVITQMANAALSGNVQSAKSRSKKKKLTGFSNTDWILDPDPLILQYCNMKKIEFPVETQKKLELHIEALYEWVQRKSSPA